MYTSLVPRLYELGSGDETKHISGFKRSLSRDPWLLNFHNFVIHNFSTILFQMNMNADAAWKYKEGTVLIIYSS